MPTNTKSPDNQFREKSFDYDIVTTYKEAIEKLIANNNQLDLFSKKYQDKLLKCMNKITNNKSNINNNNILINILTS